MHKFIYVLFLFIGKNLRRFFIIRIRKGKAKTKIAVPKEKINEEITAKEVRLIDQDNQQIGVVSIGKALETAKSSSLDLVEISANANPPVCRILDFSKYYYQKEKKAKESKKKQHNILTKEIKYGPFTEEHDYQFKKNNAVKFLLQKNKIKFTVRFKGRQINNKEVGCKLLNRIIEELKEIAEIDVNIQEEAKSVYIIMNPKKNIEKLLNNKKVKIRSLKRCQS